MAHNAGGYFDERRNLARLRTGMAPWEQSQGGKRALSPLLLARLQTPHARGPLEQAVVAGVVLADILHVMFEVDSRQRANNVAVQRYALPHKEVFGHRY